MAEKIVNNNRRDQLNQIVKMIVNYSEEDTKKLVHFLKKEGYTYEKIGDILGVAKQAIQIKFFPKQGLTERGC